jgi:soluble lytic murein transglycosylase-like protein
MIMQPRVVAAQDPNLNAMIDRIAGEQGVETHLVHSVIRTESNYNSNAVSPKGAQGIMQLIPSTARRFGVSNTFDAQENIQGGVRYLRFLLDYYKGDYPKAIAAYNAGEGAVDKYNGIPPYAETQIYVDRVARNLKAARDAAATQTEPRQFLAGLNNETETTRPIQASTGSDGRIYYRTP